MLLDLETSLAQSSSPSLSESSDPLSLPQTYLDDPDHPLKSPMLGVIIVEFLGMCMSGVVLLCLSCNV